jgi:translocation protein SEC63
MARFYHEVKEKTSINALLEIIANSPEYEKCRIQNANMGVFSVEDALTELSEKVKLAMSAFASERWDKTKKYRQEHPRAFRNSLLLHAHLFRIPTDNKKLQEEQEAVIENALRLLGGVLQISVAHSWLDVTINCIELGQLIIQAMPPYQHALFQLPYINPEIIKHCDTKKRKINTITDLLNLSDEDRRSLLRTLDDDQYNKVVEVAKSFPRIKVTNVEFKVLGEREDEAAIAPGVFVTCFIKLRQIRYDEPETVEGEEYIDTEINEVEEKKEKMRTLFDKAVNPNDPIYAPYLMMEKRPGWWLMMGNPQVNKSLTPPTKINDLVDEKVLRFTFQAPPKTGTFPITLYVKSDCSLGFDIVQEVKLVVVPAPKYHVFEDEISEPEEDSLAGQLAAMKQEMANEKKKNAAKKNDDDDEDSSDYESSDDE